MHSAILVVPQREVVIKVRAVCFKNVFEADEKGADRDVVLV